MKHIIYNAYSQEHYAQITLDHAEKHNALNAQDVDDLIAAIKETEKDKTIRVLIISGKGEKTFCAGASFEHLKDDNLKGDAFSVLAQTLVDLSIPSICLLNGSVYGGGVELALACDFRIGLEHNKLQVPVAKLGLCYSAYGLKLYHAVLGLSTSKRILTTAEKFAAPELLKLGFYDFIFADIEQAQQHTQQLTKQISQLAPLAVQGMRHTLNEIASQNFDAKATAQREQKCLNSKDKEEGFSAILEKRPAQFKNQ